MESLVFQSKTDYGSVKSYWETIFMKSKIILSLTTVALFVSVSVFAKGG